MTTPPFDNAAIDAVRRAGPAGADVEAHRAVLRDLRARMPDSAPDDSAWPESCRLDWLVWMIEAACTRPMALDKLARWTGYIQGVATARQWIRVDEERYRTRPVFHAAAQTAGRGVPETIGQPISPTTP